MEIAHVVMLTVSLVLIVLASHYYPSLCMGALWHSLQAAHFLRFHELMPAEQRASPLPLLLAGLVANILVYIFCAALADSHFVFPVLLFTVSGGIVAFYCEMPKAFSQSLPRRSGLLWSMACFLSLLVLSPWLFSVFLLTSLAAMCFGSGRGGTVTGFTHAVGQAYLRAARPGQSATLLAALPNDMHCLRLDRDGPHFVQQCQPFVARGIQDIPNRRWGGVVGKWTLERLARTAPPDIALLTAHTNRAAPEPPLTEVLSVQELLGRISGGATTNVKASPELFGGVLDRTAIDVAHLNELRSLPTTTDCGPLSALLFIGGGGTFTRVHSDPFVNLYLQLEGVKRWCLFPPQEAPGLDAAAPRGDFGQVSAFTSASLDVGRMAGAAPVRGFSVDLRPGDLLHIPAHWFHSVENLGPATEPVMGCGFGWMSAPLSRRSSLFFHLGHLVCPLMLSPTRSFLWRQPRTVDDPIVMTACRKLRCSVPYKHRTEKATEGVA
jgi:hypothetical protein